jgi:hypothetical protein
MTSYIINIKQNKMGLQVATTSKQFRLNAPDWLKGLLVATFTAPITLLYTSIQAGSFQINWQAEGLVAAAGFLGYIIKNFLTPAQTTITGTPAPNATTTVVIPPTSEVKAGAVPIVSETPKKQ